MKLTNRRPTIYSTNAAYSISKGGKDGRSEGVVSHANIFNNPRYTSITTDFIRSTGFVFQIQALDKDQQQESRGANGQTTGYGNNEEAPVI